MNTKRIIDARIGEILIARLFQDCNLGFPETSHYETVVTLHDGTVFVESSPIAAMAQVYKRLPPECRYLVRCNESGKKEPLKTLEYSGRQVKGQMEYV